MESEFVIYSNSKNFWQGYGFLYKKDKKHYYIVDNYTASHYFECTEEEILQSATKAKYIKNIIDKDIEINVISRIDKYNTIIVYIEGVFEGVKIPTDLLSYESGFSLLNVTLKQFRFPDDFDFNNTNVLEKISKSLNDLSGKIKTKNEYILSFSKIINDLGFNVDCHIFLDYIMIFPK